MPLEVSRGETLDPFHMGGHSEKRPSRNQKSKSQLGMGSADTRSLTSNVHSCGKCVSYSQESCVVTRPKFTETTGQMVLEGTHMGVNLLEWSTHMDQMLTWIVKQSKLTKGRSGRTRAPHATLSTTWNSRPRSTPAAPPEPCSGL